MDISVGLQDGEHGPAVGRIRRLLDRTLESSLGRDMLFGGDAFGITEATQQSFVWREQSRVFAANSEAHGVRKDPVRIRNRGDDTRNQIVLKTEDGLGIEWPLVGFRPKLKAAVGVAKLNHDPDPGTCLTNTALHHVARA